MKHVVILLSLFFVSAYLFFMNPGNAHAQDSISINNNSANWMYDSGISLNNDIPEGWEREAALYRGWGWGLFGGGLAAAIGGYAMMATGVFECGISAGLAGGAADCSRPERLAKAGFSFFIIGGAATITGIGLLIADAVKFNPYRRASKNVSLRPEIYVSPEITGLGISGRF